MQVLRSFLHLRLQSVDEPVGSREGGGGGNKKQRERDEALPARKGSQLTRKQRKVCSILKKLKLYSEQNKHT